MPQTNTQGLYCNFDHFTEINLLLFCRKSLFSFIFTCSKTKQMDIKYEVRGVLPCSKDVAVVTVSGTPSTL